MKRHSIWVLLVVAALTTACGDSPVNTAPSTVQAPATVNAVNDGGAAAKFSTRNSDPCGDVTYVGPVRQPISVHGTTAFITWLGNDGATRGYELQFERYDVSNVWMFAMRDVVTAPEAKEHFRTEGTYRVRVRGLFCNGQEGPFTDWVVFSTESTENHDAPVVVIPPPPPGDDIPPPPPPPPPTDDGNNGHGNDDDHHDDSNPGNGNPPIDPPGQGGDNSCHLTTTAKGGHGNPPPPPSGDHNDDGHNDCGIGNQH